MNSIKWKGHEQQKAPLSTDGLDFIQQQILLAAEYAKAAGGNYILSGCADKGSSVGDGVLILNGEIIEFAESTKETYIRIVETKESVVAYTDTYADLYTRRHAEFGTNVNGVDNFEWEYIKPFPTNKWITENYATNQYIEANYFTNHQIADNYFTNQYIAENYSDNQQIAENYVPKTRTVNGHALSENITLFQTDVLPKLDLHDNGANFDSYTEPGEYIIDYYVTEQPGWGSYFLKVAKYTTAYGTYTVQYRTYLNSNYGNLSIRLQSGGTWTEWNVIPPDKTTIDTKINITDDWENFVTDNSVYYRKNELGQLIIRGKLTFKKWTIYVPPSPSPIMTTLPNDYHPSQPTTLLAVTKSAALSDKAMFQLNTNGTLVCLGTIGGGASLHWIEQFNDNYLSLNSIINLV